MPKKTTKRTSRAAVSDRAAHLTQSARQRELVAVIGTGVSAALTGNKVPAVTWKGLIAHGFDYGLAKGKLTAAQVENWKVQLNSSDMDDLLSAAEFVGRKLEAPNGALYGRWLESALKSVHPANGAMKKGVQALHDAAIPIATLNYDQLLEQVTGLAAINLSETRKVAEWMRRDAEGILHLHGSWDAPQTCILGIRDYETTLRNEVRDLFQRNLGAFRRLLFIGCGDTFADPNFSALIAWLRQHLGTAAPQHYALVRNSEVPSREADPAWRGFVEPVGYGEEFEDLPAFLSATFEPAAKRPSKPTPAPGKAADTASRHATLLRDYRAFLVKDCGQMTIEGVRADMDTAQRRFDLERLFVPISVLPSPPEIPASDPERERKLLAWQEKNKDPLPFGKVFAKKKRVALLALPGGGKTLLLKRLAVAYADAGRRGATADGLPELDLMPVLIRCREWREHIHRPIPTLLNNISDITGQPQLAGLSEALLPLFRNGRILLLIDGLDEIHDDALRATFADNLESFLRDYELTRLVVTSREAGFSLVAPTLARFCERWRLAPLDSAAIAALCDHWHSLMIGDSPDAKEEAKNVAETLLKNDSLHRLAENPLLLTMLLVVKHGAGRLPPDRVSLYGRAVEVLLDTWNIKGHEPLSLKEAVPQLACVALELMRAGKQTATETELLKLLEEARERVPQIRRYARDTPQAFLRRVELRSSLLVEAGRQKEGAGTVPFYQFRHLTFQEYLAAVAAVEGHYFDYDPADTVLTPLQDHLLADEWKEVVTMSAVLARKQAEPLLSALVQEASRLPTGTGGYNVPLPAPISRLVQALVEEAEAAPETLTSAFQQIALHARGCESEDDWAGLCSGPYGEELFHQAWTLYATRAWHPEEWLRFTCAEFAFLRRPPSSWAGMEGRNEVERLLNSDRLEDVSRALLTQCGDLWGRNVAREAPFIIDSGRLERYFFSTERCIYEPATWAWALERSDGRFQDPPSPEALDKLLSLYFEAKDNYLALTVMALAAGLPRKAWRPTLTDEQRERVRQADDEGYSSAAACVIAFHAQTVWPDRQLAGKLLRVRNYVIRDTARDAMLEELEIDEDELQSLKAAARDGV